MFNGIMKTFAALFDWDGVVVHSAEAHKTSWERLVAAKGLALPPAHFERGFGMRVVAVTTTCPREALHEADLVVDRLDELSIDRVAQLVNSTHF